MTKYLDSNFDLNSKQLIEVLDEVPFWSAPFGIKLLENIIYKKGISVLDIGSGAGFPLTEIAIRLGETSTVYGIDPWDAAMDRMEKKIRIYGLNNVELIRGEIENLPLPDNSMDLVVSNNGLNNVADLNKALAECARVCKSQGQFVQTVNLNSTMVEFYDVLKSSLLQEDLKEYHDKVDEHIYEKRKPLEEYISLIEKHGFEVKSVIHDEFHYTFVDGTTMLNAYFIRLAFLDSWKELVPKEKRKDIFTHIESKINKQAEKEGFFKLGVPFVVIDARKK